MASRTLPIVCVVGLLLLSRSGASAFQGSDANPVLGRRSLLQSCPADRPNLCYNNDGSKSTCCPSPGGCSSTPGPEPSCQKTVTFGGIGEGPFSSFTADSQITVNGQTLQPYKVMLESNKNYGGYQFAQVLNFAGAPIGGSGAADKVANFDRTSLFAEFGKYWAVTQNEQVAASMYITELTQSADGTLTPVKSQFVKQNNIFGMWRPCSGTLTPWKTHLGGEENTPQTRGYPNLVWGQNLAASSKRGKPNADSGIADQAKIHGLSDPKDVSPYWYGWVVEVDVTNAAGDYTVAKRYAMGRSGKEMLVVMPDQQTVYISEDQSSNGALYMFKATVPGDLRKGKLYAAKWTQTSASNGGSAQISWIPLNPEGGDVDESIVQAVLAGTNFSQTKARFEDLFDYLEPTYQAGTGTPNSPPAGYVSVVVEADGIHEWLRLKPGKGPLASVLESRRMAAYVGATTEFSKFEGMAFDPQSNSIFIGCTTVDRSMLDNPNVQFSYDAGGPNHVRLEKIPGGVVYRMNLQYNGQVGSSYVAADMYPELISPPAAFDAATGDVSPDEICAPDNVGIDVESRTLFISEDGDGHPNNYLWAHNLITKEKKRIFAARPDAEVTSGYYFPNVGGFSYLMATSQGVYPAVVGYWAFPKDQNVAPAN